MKRITIVGCGAIAKTHALAIQDMGCESVVVRAVDLWLKNPRSLMTLPGHLRLA